MVRAHDPAPATRLTAALALPLAVLIAACVPAGRDSPEPVAGARDLEVDCSPADSAAVARLERGKADRGFGGFYVDDERRLVIVATDSSTAEAAHAAIARELRARRAAAPEGRVDIENYRIQIGRYSLAQLGEWKRDIGQLAAKVGLTALDADEVRNIVEVSVRAPEYVPLAECAILRLGIPRDAFEVDVQGPEVLRRH